MIEFEKFRGRELSSREKQFVTNLLINLKNKKDYYTNLQVIYNNSVHFTTVNFSVCSFADLKHISKISTSASHALIVHGDIHKNNHASGLLIDAYTNQTMFVEDTYIRIKIDGEIQHILVGPPKIKRARPYYFNYQSQHCDAPSYMIPPVFEF